VALQRLLERGAEEGRLDDAPDVILNRLRLYHGLTEPVVDRYRSDGMLQAVDGEQTMDEVFAAVEDALERARAQGPDPVEPDPAEVRSS
jgi:adenylate kinase